MEGVEEKYIAVSSNFDTLIKLFNASLHRA